MPKDKLAEQRNQTQHKLELMSRYWITWCSILSKVRDQPFCPLALWLVDTHAGKGIHESEGSPDGVVPGTPLQAVLAARATQRAFGDVVVRVRATDIKKRLALELDGHLARYRGDPPALVDVRVNPTDWVEQVPSIVAEIAAADHDHGGLGGHRPHNHRSLWFVDPYGIDGIDHAILMRLPPGSEIVVNFDALTAVRFAARALGGEAGIEDILNCAYGGKTWLGVNQGAQPMELAAAAFAESFAARYTHRTPHALRPTGSQVRYMVHLTNSPTAATAFAKAVRRALAAGTVIAGRLLTQAEKKASADRLFELFRGQALTIEDMHGVGIGLDLTQLRTVCGAADGLYGHWHPRSRTMEWLDERTPDPTLFG